MALSDISQVLRAASTLGSGRGPERRRERYAEQRMLEGELQREQQLAEIKAQTNARDEVVKILSDPTKAGQMTPESRDRLINIVRTIDNKLGNSETAIPEYSQKGESGLPADREKSLFKANETLLSGIPEDYRGGLSRDHFVDPRKQAEAIRGVMSEVRQGGKTLEERLIMQLPESERPAATERLLNKKLSGTESEFERTVESLVSRGVIDRSQGDNLILQRLSTQASGRNERIIFDPSTNTFSIERGSSLGANPITANKEDELRSQRDFVNRGVEMLEDTINDPQKLGAVASIASGVKTAAEVSGDLATTFPGAGFMVESAKNAVETIVDASDQGEARELFSDKLDQLSLLENSIGLLLARTRSPDSRIPVDVIKRSIDDVKLRGLRSDSQVRNRLSEVLRQLKRAKTDLDARIPGGGQTVIRFDAQGNRID